MRAYETDDENTADADLVLKSRSGDSDAFGELWRRHHRSGIAAARSISHDLDPDDLVQEAYAKVFQAIRRGGGPTGSFRAYLFTAIRNTAASWGRAAGATHPDDEIDEHEDPATSEAAVDAALDHSLTVTAFRSLPSRWQEVLWYTEVEGMKPREVAPLLGLEASAVSQLAFRAREGLRESWIQAHISAVPSGSECTWTIERIGAHARDNLGARDRARLDAHIAECAKCAIVASEAEHVGSRLVMVLLPLAVGVTGAGGYLATLQQGGEQAMAMAAMPGAVVDGTSVVDGASVSPELVGHGAALFGHLVDQGAALIGAAGAGVAGLVGAGSAAPKSSGGFLSVAGIVTAGVASVAIAAVVAAATVLGGGLGAGSSASALDDSTTAAQVAADDALAEASDEQETVPPALKQPAPKTDPKPDPAPKPVLRLVPDLPLSDDEAAAEPSAEDSAGEPATDEPGTDDSGSGDEGTEDPGTDEPDTDDPDDNTDDPGDGDSEPEFTQLKGEADWVKGAEEPTATVAISGGKPGEEISITEEPATSMAGASAIAAAGAATTTVTLEGDGTYSGPIATKAAWVEHGADLVASYTSDEADAGFAGRFGLAPFDDDDGNGEDDDSTGGGSDDGEDAEYTALDVHAVSVGYEVSLESRPDTATLRFSVDGGPKRAKPPVEVLVNCHLITTLDLNDEGKLPNEPIEVPLASAEGLVIWLTEGDECRAPNDPDNSEVGVTVQYEDEAADPGTSDYEALGKLPDELSKQLELLAAPED